MDHSIKGDFFTMQAVKCYCYACWEAEEASYQRSKVQMFFEWTRNCCQFDTELKDFRRKEDLQLRTLPEFLLLQKKRIQEDIAITSSREFTWANWIRNTDQIYFKTYKAVKAFRLKHDPRRCLTICSKVKSSASVDLDCGWEDCEVWMKDLFDKWNNPVPAEDEIDYWTEIESLILA